MRLKLSTVNNDDLLVNESELRNWGASSLKDKEGELVLTV